MTVKKTKLKTSKLDKIVADTHQHAAQREKDFREQALKLYPWVCGRCSREFSRGNLQELTVHHRDHNHDNNPADGSNWELLCVYCHDNEHSRYLDATEVEAGDSEQLSVATQKPFADLKNLLKDED